MDLKNTAEVPIEEFVNKKSKTYKDLNVDISGMPEKRIAGLLADNPKAIKRPVISDGKAVVIGFDRDAINQKFFKA